GGGSRSRPPRRSLSYALRRRQSRRLRSLPAPAPAKPAPALLGGSVEPTPVDASLEPATHAATAPTRLASYGARRTPCSVTIPLISSAGVTSKAGFRAAHRT